MKKNLLFTYCLLLISICTLAQSRTVTGKVTDKNTGEPLNGVSVILDSKKLGGVSTKEDGSYSINVKSSNSILIFSYVGYNTQAISLLKNTVIDVALVPSLKVNDEVVVVGYGTQKKSSVTGAVSKYKNERLDEAPVSRLDQALQGRIAGVQITNTSSEAGSDPRVRVRGLSSINAGGDPLVVVDGHPVPDGLAFVNMADVESVEVLKDAASAAIYGSRAASGVILITTKQGKVDKPRYTFKYSAGAKTPYQLYPMMTTTEYTNLLFYEAAIRAQDPTAPPQVGSVVATTPERGAYVIENEIMDGVATDWQAAALRNATIQNVLLSVSGGKSGVKYYISGNYQNDQGMMLNSEYERFNVKSRIDANLSKRVKVNFNFNPSYFKRERPSTGYIDFVRFQSFLPVRLTEKAAAFVRLNPIFSDVRAGDFAQARFFNGRVYSGTMPDGSFWTNNTISDPFSTANNTPRSILETRRITSNEYRALTSADISVNIARGLDFKTLASAYVNYSNGLDFAKRSSNRAGDVNRGVYTNRLFVDLLTENTLNYNKQIKKHSVGALVGFTAQRTRIRDEQVTGLDYPDDNITTLNTALVIDQNKANTFTLLNQIGLNSFLGRVNYGFDNKYLISASFRGDGSSYFAPGNKWGFFPSVSVGWVASREKFLEQVRWLSNLKLRGSYGVTGNNRIVDFAFVDLLFTANYPLGPGTGTPALGQVPSRDILSNENITWERTFQYNVGVDLALLRNTITLSVDAYESKTDQLLLRQAALSFTGVPQTWNNIGRLLNRGIEFELNTKNISRRNFQWSTAANLAHNRNKVLELGAEAQILNQGERTELYLNRLNGPLIQYFGFRTDGVWLSQREIDSVRAGGLSSPLSNVFVPGGLKLVDINGDNIIDARDRTIIGNPYPEFTWGLTNNFSFHGFDVSFTLQGVHGGSLVNGDANYNETKRYNKNYNQNRWLSAQFPGDGRTPYSTAGFNWMLTDYVIENASYWALRELLVGYTFPASWTKRLKLTSLRAYCSVQNLYYHFGSGYRGINPEARFSSGPYATPLVDGYQRGAFPLNQTLLFGVDVNF